MPPPTGADKTTLVVHLPDNEAGALLAMLEQFAVRGVNLSRIESRPIGDSLGRYSFSIDAEGHITDERVGEAVMGLHRRCPYVRFLGSYPRADAVEPTVHVGTADDGLRRGARVAAGACGAARRPDGQTGHPHDERAGVDARGELGDPADDVAVHLHVLAALDDDPHLLRAGVVDAADLGGQVVAHPDALQHRPRRTAAPSPRCPPRVSIAAMSSQPSSRTASGSSVMPPGSLPQLPMSRLRSRVGRHRLVVEPHVHARAAAVQVLHARRRSRRSSRPGALRLLVGVGDHRGVEARGRR